MNSEVSKMPIEWSFHYNGPITPSDDRKCAMCNAIANKACGRDGHEHGAALNCSSCAAAKSGLCANHCGVAAALADHPDSHGMTAEHRRTFDVFAAMLGAHVAAFPEEAGSLYVHAVAHERQPGMALGVLEVEIKALA